MSHAAPPSETLAGASLARPSRRLVAVLVLVAAFSMSMSIYVALTHTFFYHGHDEGPNASYAVQLYEGHLPTIDSPVAMDPERYPEIYGPAMTMDDDAHREIWTANHPPVYYASGVPFVALANALHTPWILPVGMRLVAALAYGVTVLLIGLVAFEVTPRRPAVAVLATGVAASCSVLADSAGFIMNDSVATAFSSLAVLFTLRILRMGLTRNRLIVLTAAGALAAASKAPGVITVMMCGAALLVGLVLRNRTRAGVWRAVWATAIATGVPGVLIGWFYVRNIMLYGDPTASTALLAKYQRAEVGSWFDVMTAPRFWHGWFDSVWVPLRFRAGPIHLLVDAGILVALVGLAIGVIVRVRDHRRGVGLPVSDVTLVRTPRSAVSLAKTPSVATIGLLVLVAHAVVILVNLAQFRAGGGNPHERYLMTVIPLVAIVLSIGLLAFVGLLPRGDVRRNEEIVATAVTGLLMLFAVVMFLSVITSPGNLALMVPGMRPIAVGVLGLGVLGGFVALPVALWRRRTPDPAEPVAEVHIVEPRRDGQAALEAGGDLVGR